MMMKKILFMVSILFCGIACQATDDQKVNSKVQKVTVFLTGAQVTRTANVNITGGTSTLVFENISPDIDVQSIQVRSAGDFTILSVKHEMNYLNEQIKQKKVQELQAQQKLLRDKLSLQNSLLAINQEEANMLTKNQIVSGKNSNLDLIKLKQALDFQTQRLTDIKKKEQAINDEIVLLNTELQKFDRQIADIIKGSSKATSNVLVTVSSKNAVQSLFTLTYVVNNAGWYPTYDIRAKNINSPVTISYKANVTQQSGEEWNNIKLTLSTGNPTVSGSKPQLTPDYLSLNMYYAQPAGSITKITGKVFDQTDGSPLPGVTIKVKGTSIGTMTDAGGNYSIQIPGGNPMLEYGYVGYENTEQMANSSPLNIGLKPRANQLNEVVVTGYSAEKALQGRAAGIQIRGLATAQQYTTTPVSVQQTENQTNIEFNIANPYTIPTDGKQYLVEINEVNTNATYQYYVAPKLSTDVFLTAQITDWNKYNFLSGEANLFFEGTFIGKSLLDTHATGDTLNLSLGTDKNIVVTRTLQTELAGKQFFGSNKKETKDWLITVKNRKNQPVKLLVEDQVPVSQNSDINVRVEETTGGQLDKLAGKLSWNLNLNPLGEKQLHLKYQVIYPKDKSVIVQ